MKLTGCSLILSAIGTVLITLLCGLLNSIKDIWIPLVIFVGIFIGIIGLVVLSWIPFALAVNTKEPIKKPSKFYYFLYDMAVDLFVFWSGAKVIINDNGIKLGEGPYFFTVNHRSKFDTMILNVIYKKQKIRFVAKTENFKIPIVGPVIYKSGFLQLKRDDNREALKTVLKAVEYLKNKEFSVGLCPEGTRNQQGRWILPFRSGCFKIPMRANVPIVVTTLDGTEKISKNFPFKRTKVYLDVLKVIEPSEYASKTATEVGVEVRSMMVENLKKYGVEEKRFENDGDDLNQVA